MAKKRIHIVFVFAFFAMLATPTLVQVLALEKNTYQSENRRIQPFPSFNFQQPLVFFSKFKSYYKDNFGLRLTLFEAYSYLVREWFHENPLPNKVIEGNEGWLYLSYQNVLAEMTGTLLFSSNELSEIADNISQAREWALEKDIKLYISVAPNKYSVYPENLPFSVGKNKTKCSQLKNFLKREIDFDLVDLKETILPAKGAKLLYHKEDTHWSDLGAFWGYQRLMQALQQDFKSLKGINHTQLKFVKETHLGDLKRMLHLREKEQISSVKVLDSVVSERVENQLPVPKYTNGNPGDYEYRFRKSGRPLKVLVFRDSFSYALSNYLNETFGECVYIYDFKFDKNLVLKEQPDLIVYEVAERNLSQLKEL